MSIETQIQSSVYALVDLEEDELEIELGRRLELNKKELASEEVLTSAYPGDPTLDQAELMGPLDFLRDVAVKFVDKFNYLLYRLICDPSDPDHEQVKASIVAGTEKLAYILAGLLAANFGMLPGIAAVVATLIAKRLFKAGHEALCERWTEEFAS